jgi:hypothetical protein
VGEVTGKGILDEGPVLIATNSNRLRDMHRKYRPTLHPGIGISYLDTTVTVFQGTILDTFESSWSGKFVLPSRRLIFQLENIIPEGHFR